MLLALTQITNSITNFNVYQATSYISFNIYVSIQFYKATCRPYFLFQANDCHNTHMNTHAIILS